MKSDNLRFVQRLDSALKRRKGAKVVALANAKCEVCGDNMRRYIGPEYGIVCSTCMDFSSSSGCTRIEPLVITRSSIRE